MIRTHNISPTLRVEITGQEVVARDPATDESCTIATNCDAARLDKVNRIVWNRLNSIRQACRTDPVLSGTSGRDFFCDIYRAGMGALLTLIGPERADQLNELHGFFRKRIPLLPASNIQPPVIDLVNVTRHHFPIEVLPLLGKAEICDGICKGTPRDVAQVLPGYCAIIRRVSLPNSSTVAPSAKRPQGYSLLVHLFRHNKLAGVHKEIESLRNLASKECLSLAPVFPPKGHRPRRIWPELELAEIVANLSARGGELGRNPASAVYHFSCHLLREEPGPFLEMRPDGIWPSSGKYFLEELRAASSHVEPMGVSVLFLNTCRSGVNDPVLRTSAVEVFQYFKPRCLVGTLADVPDLAAAEFSIKFYQELAGGTAVGAALRIARLMLLDKFNNPFGLLFVSHFGEDVYTTVRQNRWARYVPDENEAVLAGAFDQQGGFDARI